MAAVATLSFLPIRFWSEIIREFFKKKNFKAQEKLVSFCVTLEAEKYTSRWDNIDIDEILNSDRLLENYKNCLMEKGRCTAEGTELKKNLPDALKTECSKCTAKQKVNTEKIINYMIENKKEWWEELQKKYDPSGTYYDRYLERKKAKQEKSNEKDEKEKKS